MSMYAVPPGSFPTLVRKYTCLAFTSCMDRNFGQEGVMASEPPVRADQLRQAVPVELQGVLDKHQDDWTAEPELCPSISSTTCNFSSSRKVWVLIQP
jgi:hypothetical protein